MQGTSKPLPSTTRNETANLFNAGLGLSDVSQNTRVTNQKELFIKLSDTIQSTRRLNHFLVEGKILDNG